jgi:hypothetical protein
MPQIMKPWAFTTPAVLDARASDRLAKAVVQVVRVELPVTVGSWEEGIGLLPLLDTL